MNYITKLRKKNPAHNIPSHDLKMISEEFIKEQPCAKSDFHSGEYKFRQAMQDTRHSASDTKDFRPDSKHIADQA